MTNINCSANCVYQKDGKCCFEKVSSKTVTPASNCAYFLEKNTIDINCFFVDKTIN